MFGFPYGNADRTAPAVVNAERQTALPSPAVWASPCDSIEAVLREADFVSLHCPGSTPNRHLINAERLALMKPGAFLINTAQGCCETK